MQQKQEAMRQSEHRLREARRELTENEDIGRRLDNRISHLQADINKNKEELLNS